MIQLLHILPIPVELYKPDGTMIFINQAFLKLNKIQDAALVVGKYNLLRDPAVNDQRELREYIRRAFRGEKICAPDVPAIFSSNETMRKENTEKNPLEMAFGDMFFSPLWSGEEIACILCVFTVKRIYQGRPEVIRAKEYIATHWQDKYNPKTIAKSVSMSIAPFYSLFKRYTGMTPGEYHRNIKIEHITEKLMESNLSIKEVFASCSEDSRGRVARVFKEITGFSPKEYRKVKKQIKPDNR